MTPAPVGIHRLEGFYWVARTGGYASAARAFPYPITQPAVHSQVKKLEAELGSTLFERATKDRMILTPAGKRLFEFVQPFYEGLPAVLRSLGADELAGELRIAAPTMHLFHLLPAWLKRLRQAHPRLEVVVQETHWGDAEGLQRGEFDLLVDYLPEVPDDLATMQVGTLRPYLVLPSDHPLADMEHETPHALAEETFVGYLPGHLADLQEEALRMYAIEPPSRVTASSAEAILGFVAAGLGYSLLGWIGPEGPRAEGVSVHPLRKPEVAYPVWAAWRKNTPENPMLDAALEAAPRP